MKKIILPFLVACIVLSCSDAQTSNQSADADSLDMSDGKNITTRDISITKSNSYSSLFLDTAAVSAYISGEKIPSKIARRIWSFYNARNFQFAWFSGDGLTEQARGFWNLHDYVTTYDTDSSLKDKALQKNNG